MSENSVKSIGKLHPPSTMFLRHEVGTATGSDDGREYEVFINVGDMCPIIRSKTSGRWFTLSWPELIAVAVGAGIDEPGNPTPDTPNPKP